ncbi:MAG: aminotransferase class V-fold PLP-dependent enzyme [Planctomycetes bacterium]|nr:aminotransferase class V-fold PLP-dependent enzyme [Planctomycetota bacterium]
MSQRIYLDANAGLPVRTEVLEEYLRIERDFGANPASLHRAGRGAQGVLESARSRVAALLRCEDSEVVFTSGATEACNLALFGIVRCSAQVLGRKLRLVSSLAEHPAVVGPLRLLQLEGHHVDWLHLDVYATNDLGSWPEDAPDLVAMQWANNETGAVQPLSQMLDLISSDSVWFCDAVQGIGKLAWNESLCEARGLVISGHKFGAPKGIGALVLKNDVLFEATIVGGGHQGGRRPGTENPALASALALALELAMQEQAFNLKNWDRCRLAFLQELTRAIPDVQFNHPPKGGLNNTISLTFPNLDGRLLLPTLDADGLEVSAGSACSSGSPTPSTVLLATGMTQPLANASIRVSLCPKMDTLDASLAGSRLATAISRLYDVAKR